MRDRHSWAPEMPEGSGSSSPGSVATVGAGIVVPRAIRKQGSRGWYSWPIVFDLVADPEAFQH